MTIIKPLICGVSGTTLSLEEKKFISKMNPLGFVLFKKNIFDRKQASNLTQDLKAALGDRVVPILIDQEGGQVLRLRKEEWRQPPSPLDLGKFAYMDSKDAFKKTVRLVFLNSLLIALDMKEIGVNVNCYPVADLLIPGAHHITGTRSFGPDPIITASLVNAAASGMQLGSAQPIMKHMLGQGRASCDSHIKLPRVNSSLDHLKANDFKVFELAQNINWGMPAHIIYEALDSENPVTYSKKSINYIRHNIGFKGILISDCMTMKALPETWEEKITKAIKAGIDLILYGSCNYNIIEEITNNLSNLPGSTWQKIQASLKNNSVNPKLNYQIILQEFEELLTELESELKTQIASENLKLILSVLKERCKIDADYSSPLYNV